jgi:PIN domain nuclease of toxin-antitoxin system
LTVGDRWTSCSGRRPSPDRLLVAQALHEPARLLTVDRALTAYSDLVELIA